MRWRRNLINSVVATIIGLSLVLVPAHQVSSVTPPPGTWTKNATNPVFAQNRLSAEASVIYDVDEGIYKMWYTRNTDNLTKLDTFIDNILALDLGNLITDIKNLDFNAIANNDTTKLKNIIDYLAGLTINDIENILIGTSTVISYATSADGINWQYQSDVLKGDLGQWDKYYVAAPSVIKNGVGDYEMWYTGGQADLQAIKAVINDLALLSSDNMTTLLNDLLNLNITNFITHAIAAPGSVVSLLSDIGTMLNSTHVAIGHATSTDGIGWTKDASPVLTKDTGDVWDKYGVGAPSVIRNGPTDYEMWYTGCTINYSGLLGLLFAGNLTDVVNIVLSTINVAIGHATSADGITWNKDVNNPVLTKGTSTVWDGYGVSSPSVIRVGPSDYQMWYTGINIAPDPLLNFIKGTSGLWASIRDGIHSSIGYATSIDGINWDKDMTSPVLTKGGGYSWDRYGVGAPSVVLTPPYPGYQMWYTGGDLNLPGVILAILNGNNLALAIKDTHVAIGYATTAKTLKSITITPSAASIPVGRMQILFSAIATYSDESTANITASVFWASSNETVAMLGTGGMVIANEMGTTNISATFDTIVSNNATLTVTAPELDSIMIDQPMGGVAVGKTFQFTATGTYSDFSTANITSTVTWTSSDTSKATIDAAGLAKGIATGSTNITASSGNITSFETLLTVMPADLVSITVTPLNASIPAGKMWQIFSALGKYSDNTTADITDSVFWTSSNETVAMLGPGGMVIANQVGTANISASFDLIESNKALLTVTEAELDSIMVEPFMADIAVGGTQQFTATGMYSNFTTANITSTVTWASSDTSKATIDAAGLAKGIAVGFTTITASSGNITSFEASLTITSAGLESITVTPVNPSIPLGLTQQFSAMGKYSDNSTANVTSFVTWWSENPMVATLDMGGLATSYAIGTTNVTATLDGIEGSTTLNVTAAAFTQLVISPDNPAIAAGYTIQLYAIEYYSDGSTIDVTNNATWESSNTATANITTQGLARGRAIGTVTITATYNGHNDTTTLTVNPPTLDRVEIDQVYLATDNVVPSVPAGKTLQLYLTGIYSDGTAKNLTTDNQTIWASITPATANITKGGLVTGLTVGAIATIRATNIGTRDTANVTVIAPLLESITVTPDSPVVFAGDNVSFTATGRYSNASTAVLTSVNWTSSNPATANISANGLAITKAIGTTNITASYTTSYGIFSGKTLLTATSVPLTSISVTPANPSTPAGRTKQFTATGNFSGLFTANITSLVTWSSSDTTKATVVSGGLATGKAIGTARIIATRGTVSGNTTLTISAAVLDSIAVTPASTSVAAGRTRSFSAIGTYSNSTTANLTATANWTSSNTAVATIIAKGQAKSKIVGTANITASYTTSYGIFSNKSTLTVTAPVLDTVKVTPVTATVAAGKTAQYSANGTYSDNSTVNITNTVSWSSANTSVASVSATGLATGYTTGSVTITATKSGKSGTATLIVTPAVLDSISVTPLNQTIRVGNTLPFRAMGTYSNNIKTDLTTSANWTSSNTAVTTIGRNTGSATGVATGAANITATWGTINSKTLLTVTAIPLTSITVTPASPSVAAGKTKQFNATGNYSGVFTANITALVTWSSSNNNTARVNSAGLATSYAPGTTKIFATKDSISGNTTLTVSAALLESITVTPKSPTITFVSGTPPTLQFRATSINSDGSTTDVTSTATWTSSNGAAATISAGGLVTTVAAGTTVIKAAKSGKSDNTTLTVLADTIPPQITLSSPTPGLTLRDKALTVSGKVDDKAAVTTTVIVNGVSSAMTLDSNGNFSKGVSLNAGSNNVEVRSTDVAGNTGKSPTITVVVDPSRPSLSITSPAGGLLTKTSALTVTGNVTNATTATLRVNRVATTINVVGGGFTTNVNLTEGENIIALTAYTTGHAGDTDYLGTAGSRSVTLDSKAPVVAIVSPSSGGVFNTPLVTISGTVDDPRVATAQLILNGSPQTISLSGGAFSQQVTLAPGNNTMKVIAVDTIGNSGNSGTITVTLDTSRPEVTITTPANRLLTNIAGQTVSGNVSDPSITTAGLYLNSATPSQTISVAPDGTFNAHVTLATGANTIEVRVSDAAGNTGTSGVANVTLDNTAPVLSIGLNDPTEVITITVTSNEALKELPSVAVNPVIVMTPVDVNKWVGVYGSSGSPIAAGSYTVSANGTDIANNLSNKTATFTKETIDVSGTEPTTVSTSSTTLQVETNGAVNNADISLTQHLDNPSGNVGNPEDASLAAGAFVEIVASPELRDNLSQIYIQVDYDPATLPPGTDESTLKLYLWDETTGTWQVVPDSGVNTTEHYIYGTVTHLSKYGAFGSAEVAPPSTPTSEGGGAGSMTAAPLPGTTSLSSVITTTGTFMVDVVAQSADTLCKLTIAKDTIGLRPDGRPLYEITMVKATDTPATPADQSVVGLVYDFGPDGATFDQPIKLTITYDPAKITKGITEEKLFIAVWDKDVGKWVKLDSEVDTAANTISAWISHFTEFTVMASARPAAFTTSNLSITPAAVNIGEKVTISVTVTNTGDLAGDYKATLKIDNAAVDTRQVTLAGGASEQVTFTTTQNVAGTYTITVDTLSGKFVVKGAVSFALSNLSITPAAVNIGEKVTISVTVTNTGDIAGDYKATLKIDNVVVDTRQVTLTGGASEQVTFTTSQNVAGTYTITVDTLSGKFVVNTPVAPPPTPKPLNWWLIGGIAAVLIIGGAIFLVIRRRV